MTNTINCSRFPEIIGIVCTGLSAVMTITAFAMKENSSGFLGIVVTGYASICTYASWTERRWRVINDNEISQIFSTSEVVSPA